MRGTYALEAPHLERTRSRETETRRRRRGDKRIRTRRGNNAAHCRTSRVCIMRSRAVSRIRFSCRCGSVDREETRYLSNKLGNICDTLYAQVSPRRAGRTHNKRMRITNAAVRYRVSGDNYIGRKNDTELRAIRWQREITPAMHFFFFALTREKLSCETAYTARSFLNATKRHGINSLSLFPDFHVS